MFFPWEVHIYICVCLIAVLPSFNMQYLMTLVLNKKNKICFLLMEMIWDRSYNQYVHMSLYLDRHINTICIGIGVNMYIFTMILSFAE